jgi:hypothetical protein
MGDACSMRIRYTKYVAITYADDPYYLVKNDDDGDSAFIDNMINKLYYIYRYLHYYDLLFIYSSQQSNFTYINIYIHTLTLIYFSFDIFTVDDDRHLCLLVL